MDGDTLTRLHAEAHQAFDRADLVGAFDDFERLLAALPDDDPNRAAYHYMVLRRHRTTG